jgi:hypothetical protein
MIAAAAAVEVAAAVAAAAAEALEVVAAVVADEDGADVAAFTAAAAAAAAREGGRARSIAYRRTSAPGFVRMLASDVAAVAGSSSGRSDVSTPLDALKTAARR